MLLHHEIDAAVLRLALAEIIARDRLRLAVADRAEPGRREPGLDQVVGDRLRAFLGQFLVGRVIAIAVGMSGDLDIGVRTPQRGFDQAVEQAG